MKRLVIMLAALAVLISAGTALADDRDDFGGQGQAWIEKVIGGGTYWDHFRNDDLSKDWETPDGGVRFTQPGRAEGRADDHSVIEPYPCPGTQVYPGSNNPD